MDVARKYNELITSYIEIKPILWDLHMRCGNRFIDTILNEIRALNDHVARCYREGITEEDEYNELCKAEGHLKRIIYDCFKQLNIIFYEYVNKYENKYFGIHWLNFNGGLFWSDYQEKRKAIYTNVEDAKKNEGFGNSDKSFESYQKAYVIQGEVYEMLENNKNQLELNYIKRVWQKINSFLRWLLLTLLLTSITSAIWWVLSTVIK